MHFKHQEFLEISACISLLSTYLLTHVLCDRPKGALLHRPVNAQATLSTDKYTPQKVKVAHTRLPSIWFRSCSRFLAVSLQVT